MNRSFLLVVLALPLLTVSGWTLWPARGLSLDQGYAECKPKPEPKSGSALEAICQGVAALESGHRDEAIGKFKQALTLDAKSAPAHVNLAQALLQGGDAAGAEQECRQTIANEPGFARAHQILAVILARRGSVGEAVSELNAAIEVNPKDVMSRIDLGEALEYQKKPNEALAQYQAAVQNGSNLGYYKAGVVYQEMGDKADARTALQAFVDRKTVHSKRVYDSVLADAQRRLGQLP